MKSKLRSLSRGKSLWRFTVVVALILALVSSLFMPQATNIAYAQPTPSRALPAHVTPDETFDVTVTFTAHVDNFHSIGIYDFAPTGWSVAVDKTWCTPTAATAVAADNKVEYSLGLLESYSAGQEFTVVYQVTVPIDATPGTYTFTGGYIEYYVSGVLQSTVAIGGENEVDILAVLNATFTADKTVAYVDEVITFTDATTGGTPAYTYEWSFGDGGTSTAASPTHPYTTAGTYTVSLTVTDSALDTSTKTKTDYIDVAVALAADFSADNTVVLVDEVIQFTPAISGGTPTYTYEWDFDTTVASVDSTEASPTHTYTTAGTYTVSLTVTDSLARTDTQTKTDYIDVAAQALVADFTAEATAVIEVAHQFTDLTSGGTPAYTYEWSFGDVGTSTAASPTHPYATEGTYTVSLTVTDAFGRTDTEVKADYINATTAIVLAEVQIEPASANLEHSAQVQFIATGLDQFGNDISGEVSFVWSVLDANAGGIDQTGLFTAGANSGEFTDAVKVVGTRETVETGDVVVKEALATVVVYGAAATAEIVPPLEEDAPTGPAEAPYPIFTFGEEETFGATVKDANEFEIPEEEVVITWTMLDDDAGTITDGVFTPGTKPGVYRDAIQAQMGAAVETYSVIVLPSNADTTNVKVATVAAAAPAPVDAVTEAGTEVTFSGTGNVTGDIMVTKYVEEPTEPTVTFGVGTDKAPLKFVDVFASFGTVGAPGTATVTIHYTDDEIATTIREASMSLYYWDGTAWQPAANSSVDTTNNVVSGDVPVEFLSGAPVGGGGDPLSPSLTLTPSTGIAATTLTGTGFQSDSTVTITWAGAVVPSVPSDVTTDVEGDFSAIISVPNQTAGTYEVKATDGAANFASDNFTVADMTGLQGTQGDKGEPGDPGVGTRGARGEQGETGLQGEPGAQGETGTQGEQGLQGEPGTQGPSGPIAIIYLALGLGAIGTVIGVVALLRKKA